MEDSYDGLLEGRLSPIDRNRLGGLVHRAGPSSAPDAPRGQGARGQERGRAAERGGRGGHCDNRRRGSLTSAKSLGEAGVSCRYSGATIDNDVPGTELAIGVDTAVDTAKSGP